MRVAGAKSAGGTAPNDGFRGIFAVPPTPFCADGSIDFMSFQRCIEHCIKGGSHGVVGPVNASEAIALTDSERFALTEALIQNVSGRIPVIVGVSAASTTAAVGFAKHAVRLGADAVIAMPPYVKHAGPTEIIDFYRSVARAADGLPVWIQHYVPPIGTVLSSELIAEIACTIPGTWYLKEESQYAPQAMTAALATAGGALHGVMGGMAGRYIVEEYLRGACGSMPACEVIEIHVQIWEALEEGNLTKARELHRAVLPLLNYEAMYSFTVYKAVLARRGVIDNVFTRMPGAGPLDAYNDEELDLLLESIAPLLRAGT